MSNLGQQDFISQQHYLDHYEQIIAPSIYPKWADAYRRLTISYAPQPFYLKAPQWANRIGSLVTNAQKRLLWALDFPPLDRENRHHLLNCLSYSQTKNIAFVSYFNKIKHASPYINSIDTTIEKHFDTFESSAFKLPFLLVDSLILFERPSLSHHKERCLYLIKNITEQQLMWLLALPSLRLSAEEQNKFILAI